MAVEIVFARNLSRARAVLSGMKTKPIPTLVALTALALTRFATAQESVPLEEAQNAARKVNAALPTLSNAPLSIDADLEKPHVLKGGGGGVMVIPDKKLTVDALTNAGPAITPVGQLWMLKVGIAHDGKTTPADRLRSVTITDGDKDREVQIYLLGARKNEQGTLELVIYAKDSQPLMTAALTSNTTGAQSLPLEITGRKNGEDSATLGIHLFGRYHTDLLLMKPAGQ